MMDFFEFSVLLFYYVLVYLGFFISIIYLLLNLKPKLDSLNSKIQFGLSIIIFLIPFVILLFILITPLALLQLVPVESQLFWFIFYLGFIIALLILIFKPETKKESP